MAVPIQELMDVQASVLGSMLIDSRCVAPVLELVKEDYFSGQYRTIFEAIAALFRANKKIDPVIVVNEIGSGYADLVAQLMQITPTAANVREYALRLRKKARLRMLQDAAAAMMDAETEDDIRERLDQINAVMVDRPGIRAMTMEQALADFYRRHDPAVKPDYLPWRFSKLNDYLRTVRGDLVILGGYPSDGKTTLALALAREQARTKRVGFFSFETDCGKLTDAMVCAAAQIGLAKIQLNALNANDWDTLAAISADFAGRNLEIIEAAGMTASDIRLYSQARHYDVIYIDYLQLIKAAGRSEYAQQDFVRVSANSLALKQFGRQGGPTIVALSQLSRPTPGKNGKIPPPSMSSLRSSGQIEQDADAILLMFRENQKQINSDRIITVAKNKTGIAGDSFVLKFEGSLQTFSESNKQYSPPKQSPADEQQGFTELMGNEPLPF